MTTTTTHSFDLVEQQQAFVGLLAHPLLTRDLDPELHRLVGRHREPLSRWTRRLGYRLVEIGTTFRLQRSVEPGLPAAVPADERPNRRVLVLALVVAAVLEDVPNTSVTIQAVSDATRDATAVTGLLPYDPVRRQDRKLLIAAVRHLIAHGVLRQRTREELLTGWEDSGTGPGASYAINREALLLLVDPSDLSRSRAADPVDPEDLPDTRGKDLLRRLIEGQALNLAELTASERDYWIHQRHRLISRAVEMTGGTVEQHAEVCLLILPSDNVHAQRLTDPFPKAQGAHWVALRLLDQAARACSPGPDGRLHQPSVDVDAAAARVHAELGDRLPKALQESGHAVRGAAQTALVPAGLLTVDERGDWWLNPVAARYRAATLTVAAPTAEIDPLQLDPLQPDPLGLDTDDWRDVT